MENTDNIAQALFKISEVHDRRLGEIASHIGTISESMAKIAFALTHHEDRPLELPYSGIDHLVATISSLDSTLSDGFDRLTFKQEEGDT